jgi:hypothetical protein
MCKHTNTIILIIQRRRQCSRWMECRRWQRWIERGKIACCIYLHSMHLIPCTLLFSLLISLRSNGLCSVAILQRLVFHIVSVRPIIIVAGCYYYRVVRCMSGNDCIRTYIICLKRVGGTLYSYLCINKEMKERIVLHCIDV